MTDINSLLTELLNPNQQLNANAKLETLKQKNLDSVLMNLKDVVLSTTASNQNKQLAAIELKNNFRRFWSNQENEQFQINNSTLKIFSVAVYDMVKATKGTQICVQLLELLKHLSYNEYQNSFDFKSFFENVKNDLQSPELSTIASNCFKHSLKLSKDEDAGPFGDFSKEILECSLANCKSAIERANDDPNYDLASNMLKCFQYQLQNSLNLEFMKEIFCQSDCIKIVDSIMSSSNFKYVFDNISNRDSQMKSAINLLCTCYRILICLCDSMEELSLIIEDKSIISAMKNLLKNSKEISIEALGMFAENASSMSSTMTNKLFFSICTFLGSAFLNQLELSEKEIIGLFENQMIPLMTLICKQRDSLSSNVDRMMVLSIVEDSAMSVSKHQDKLETIKQFYGYISGPELTNKQINDKAYENVIQFKKLDINSLSAWIIVMSWMIDFERIKNLPKLIDSLLEIIKTHGQKLKLVVLSLLNHLSFAEFKNEQCLIKTCNYLKGEIILTKKLGDEDEDNHNLECCLNVLSSLIEIQAADCQKLVEWLESVALELIETCLNLSSESKSAGDIRDLPVAVSISQDRLIRALSELELEEVCQNACKLAGKLADNAMLLLKDNVSAETAHSEIAPINSTLRSIELLILLVGKLSDQKSNLESKLIEIAKFIFDHQIEAGFTEGLDLVSALTSNEISKGLCSFVKDLIKKINMDDVYYDFKDVAPLLHNCFERFPEDEVNAEFIENSFSIIKLILAEKEEYLKVDYEFTIASKLLEVLVINFKANLSDEQFSEVLNLAVNAINEASTNIEGIQKFIKIDHSSVNDSWGLYQSNMILVLAAVAFVNAPLAIEIVPKKCIALNTIDKLCQLLMFSLERSKTPHHSKIASLALAKLIKFVTCSKLQSEIVLKIINTSDNNNNNDSNLNITQELDGSKEENDVTREDSAGEKNDEQEDSLDVYEEEAGFIVNQEVLENYTTKLENTEHKPEFSSIDVLKAQIKNLKLEKEPNLTSKLSDAQKSMLFDKK